MGISSLKTHTDIPCNRNVLKKINEQKRKLTATLKQLMRKKKKQMFNCVGWIDKHQTSILLEFNLTSVESFNLGHVIILVNCDAAKIQDLGTIQLQAFGVELKFGVFTYSRDGAAVMIKFRLGKFNYIKYLVKPFTALTFYIETHHHFECCKCRWCWFLWKRIRR